MKKLIPLLAAAAALALAGCKNNNGTSLGASADTNSAAPYNTSTNNTPSMAPAATNPPASGK